MSMTLISVYNQNIDKGNYKDPQIDIGLNSDEWKDYTGYLISKSWVSTLFFLMKTSYDYCK